MDPAEKDETLSFAGTSTPRWVRKPVTPRSRVSGEDYRDCAMCTTVFTPTAPGELRLALTSVKGGKEEFKDSRHLAVE